MSIDVDIHLYAFDIFINFNYNELEAKIPKLFSLYSFNLTLYLT
jgi:hypothetical protein